MGKTTDIAWTDHTFNPWIGCTPAQHPSGVVAQGCVNCYAAALNERFKWAHEVVRDFPEPVKVARWGKGAPRKLAAESTWKQVEGWARSAAKAGVRRSVFFSLGDPLDEEVPEAWFKRYMDLIRTTAVWPPVRWEANSPAETQRQLSVWGGLRHLLLTKRPWLWERIPEDVRPLVWLGTSASDQESWDLWVGDLVKARSFAGLFVSLEPQVGPVDAWGLSTKRIGHEFGHEHPERGGDIALVIQGGESGPKARPFHLEWARSVRDQCRVAGVKFYFKQAGANPRANVLRPKYHDPAGADPSEWPEDLRVRELPW